MSQRVMADEVRSCFFIFAASTNILEHICGFSGSAGTAVVTLDKAALSTDGRYFNQASKQLDENWLLLKQGIEEVPTWQDWYDGLRESVRSCANEGQDSGASRGQQDGWRRPNRHNCMYDHDYIVPTSF